MRAYSQDLRERVLRALDRGDRPTEIARRFEVSRIWVYQVRGRERKTGVRTSFPNSPDLNPIEKLFSKLKALLRKAANDRSTNSGRKSASCSAPSPQTNAQTISPLLDMYALNLGPL